MPDLIIIMSYFNRQPQLTATLESFRQYNPDDFEVVIIDDASDKPPTIQELPYLVTLITIKNKTWIQCDPSYNKALEYALRKKPRVIVIQNPECYHATDILSKAKTVTDSNYLSFGCYSLAEHEGINTIPKEQCVTDDGTSGWYNHPIHRPVGYHFCCAMTANNIRKINGFDERFSYGIGYDDNYLLHQIKTAGIKIEILSYPYVLHQWHYNSPKNPNFNELVRANYNLYNRLVADHQYRAKHLLTPDLDVKIYDCFIFFNELELLELRLRTLDNLVDYFVLVEVGMTFTGKPKELIFEKNKHLFAKYLHKIIHIKRDSLPSKKAWDNEYFNRNLISEGIKQAKPDDYIMISDVDEIPNPDSVRYGIQSLQSQFILRQKLFYYYVNCLSNTIWNGTVILKRRFLKTPQIARDNRNNKSWYAIDNGGWHYSFMGGSDKIKLKLDSFAETQVNISANNNSEHIDNCLATGKDLFHRTDVNSRKRVIPLSESTHKEVIEWSKEYVNFVK